MNKQQLYSILGKLSGHLITSSSQQESEIQRLHEALSRSLLPEDIQQLKSSQYTFEKADRFSLDQIPTARSEALMAVAEQAAASTEPEFRVFVRDVPARSSILPGSVPGWANGAAVEQTLGPFTNKDGREFWFDFFRIEKLVALYIQGVSDPALLFNVRTGLKFIDIFLPPVVNPQPIYHLPAGSIWVYSQFLAANAPAGYYTGLTIQGGTIQLSAAPILIGGKLTLAPNTVVTVELNLQQPAVQGADPTSPYGIDARSATLQLPQTITFHFSAQSQSLDQVSTAQWQVYGQSLSFTWEAQQPSYNALLQHIFIQLTNSDPSFRVDTCQSPYFHLQGQAPILASAWELPVATIDILHPTPAAGIGSLVAACAGGLSASWTGLKVGILNLHLPFVALEPGHITLADFSSGTHPIQQVFNLWKDQQNPFGSDIQVEYPTGAPFFYQSFANGSEVLLALVNAAVEIDRPVTAAGQALGIHSKSSFLLVVVAKTLKLIELFDDNILFDNTNLYQKPPEIPQPISLALHNALFKTTPVNGCFLVGQLADDLVKIKRGYLFLTFGLYAYLPTLPDPYAANIGSLRAQFRRGRASFNASPAAGVDIQGGTSGSVGGPGFIWMWLVCEVSWRPGTSGNDTVKVAFYFAPLLNQFQLLTGSTQNAAAAAEPAAASYVSICDSLLTPIKNNQSAGRAVEANAPQQAAVETFNAESLASIQQPDYQAIWDKDTACLQQDFFALLDVSTNADLMGVSFNVFNSEQLSMVPTFGVTQAAPATFPLQVEGMDVVSTGNNVRAFTLPEVSWEPVLNTAPHVLPGDPPGYPSGGFPTLVPNYYPDDGGPTRIYNNSVHLVPLSPIPVSQFIVGEYAKEKFNITSSMFTLPFGMRALAVLDKFVHPHELLPDISFNRPEFDNALTGGLQLKLNAGKLPTDDYPMFNGGTLQINNVLDLNGQITHSSTLGQSVGFIFNDEFKPKTSPSILVSRGVPLTRIDLSGYGASIFSNWLNPLAQMAQTSQSQFDVWVGRAAHEVIQVKSIIYPWGIRVVRTIILYRASTGYVYRVDTGWKAQSDGLFDFSYYVKTPALKGLFPTYQIHPGVVEGLVNVQNIVEANNQFATQTTISPGQYYLDPNNNVLQNPGPGDMHEAALLQMVFFDADILIENVVQGQVNGKVPSKKIMGFVQLAPRGIPLSQDALKALLYSQLTPIGGPIDAVIDIGQNGQKMRLNQFDVTNSFGANGTDTVFAAAVRGHIILPQDGSWGMVQHTRGTGEVTPLPDSLAVPLIRIGQIIYNVDAATQAVSTALDSAPSTQLLRLADPTELLRPPVNDTINYGFLHSTDTQKALFLTPAFKWMTGAPPNAISKLLSKTPPLFADAFRIVNSKGIFPNVGDAASNLGDAISLYSQGTEFVQNALTDGGTKVLELMQINQKAAGAVQEGYKLLKQFENFTLPNTSWTLIEIGGAFKIYIEYKADNLVNPDGSTKNVTGSLNFDVDSFANNVEDRWKSLMNDVALVVDLGPISRLMTIKGNWNAQMGSEAAYAGSDSDPSFPTPQIEFAPELQPVIEILQILQDLQTGDYKDAFQQGLKLAMSNKADSWEYKLEASKEIPVVRFPTPDFLYNDPNAPLKLEAGLKLGAYFNAALKVTTDPKQLLPTAGGYLGFYGRLSVMCVSLSIATIYAVGQVNLDIGADTKTGPSLNMKFGFGAQIVVGLPVVGNVSVLYMVGVEIYIDTVTLKVSGFMLFQGQAELLGGLVGVTITIEAKGTVSRTNDRTDLAAQVTFGLDISIFLIIDISFSTSWEEQRQIA